jgi:hypothetical protein
MKSQAEIRLQIAQSYREEAIRAAARERQIAAASSGRSSIRRSIGFSIIRIGERLAAESSLSSARSAEG